MKREVSGHMDESSRRVVLRRDDEPDPEVVGRALIELEGISAWLDRYEGSRPGPGVKYVIRHEEVVCSSHNVVEWRPPRLSVQWREAHRWWLVAVAVVAVSLSGCRTE